MKLKLVSKTLLYYLLISLPLLVIAGFLSHRSISRELNDAAEDALLKERRHIEKAISQHPESFGANSNDLLRVYKTDAYADGVRFTDSTAYDVLEEEPVTFHILHAYFRDKGQSYKIEIAKPTMEEEELMEGLLYTFTVIGLFLLLAFFAVSWLLSRTLWKPFYKTLGKLTAYDLKQDAGAHFEPSGTKEFDQLNGVLNQMIQKIQSDFLQQKEFTENASHEMQTPLAIIRANTSLLMQSPQLQREEMSQVQTIDDTVKRLSSLNKALLLLAKIDNNQFRETSKLELGAVIEKTYAHFADLIQAKEISFEHKAGSPIEVMMNAALADILFSNLFQNAIRHNFISGEIVVETSADTIFISNTGQPLTIDPGELFMRFKKNESSADSLGLGLAIVKSICALYRISIRYAYEGNKHSFILTFNTH